MQNGSGVHRHQQTSAVAAWAESFLSFCRIEKGLAPNSIAAYRQDLRRFSEFRYRRDPEETADAARLYRLASSRRAFQPQHCPPHHHASQFLCLPAPGEPGDDRSDTSPGPAHGNGKHFLSTCRWNKLTRSWPLPTKRSQTASATGRCCSCYTPPGFVSPNSARSKPAGVNLDMGILRVVGKGRKERLVPIGQCAVRAIEAYLRARTQGTLLGPRGPLSVSDEPRSRR